MTRAETVYATCVLEYSKKTVLMANGCRAKMAHAMQSWPDSGGGFEVKVRKPFRVVLSSLGGQRQRVPRLVTLRVVTRYPP